MVGVAKLEAMHSPNLGFGECIHSWGPPFAWRTASLNPGVCRSVHPCRSVLLSRVSASRSVLLGHVVLPESITLLLLGLGAAKSILSPSPQNAAKLRSPARGWVLPRGCGSVPIISTAQAVQLCPVWSLRCRGGGNGRRL